MTELNGNDFVSLLGQTSDDEGPKALLAACGVSRKLKIKKGDLTEVIACKDLGLEVTFRDERHLDVKKKEYEDGALVLSNIRMYGSGHQSFRPFEGALPFGLSFDKKPDDARTALGDAPAVENPQRTLARWDRPDYSLFIRTDAQRERVTEVSVQLPVK
jgi:hypothetical protein